MKIYRMAIGIIDNKVKAYQYIINHINKGEIHRNQNGHMMKDYVEMHVDDLAGDAWIQIGYSEWGDMEKPMYVEIYYESEFLQDEYGKIQRLPLDIEDPQKTLSQINVMIENLAGQPQEEPNDNLSDVEADAMTLRDAGMGTDEDYGLFGGEEQ